MLGQVTRMSLFVVALVVASCSGPATPPPIQIGGDYGPVTAEQLQGKHSCFATGTSGAKFAWDFDGDRFKITGDGAAIPEDALLTFLGRRQASEVIEGRWRLVDRTLILTEITADGKGDFKDVTLHPFRTPVVRVDLAGTQYVFRPLK